MDNNNKNTTNSDSSNSTTFGTEFLDIDDSSFEFDDENNSYEPVLDNIFSDNKSTVGKKKNPKKCKHFKWSLKEDNQLRQLVFIFGTNNWKNLAKKMDGRNSRQCRERWQYYLNPYLKIGNWTKEEDQLILQKTKELGPKWMTIKKFFRFRTDAMIKNRYRELIRIDQKRDKYLEYYKKLCQNVISKKSHVSQKTSQKTIEIQHESQQNDISKPEQSTYFNCFSQNEKSDDEFFLENDDF